MPQNSTSIKTSGIDYNADIDENKPLPPPGAIAAPGLPLTTYVFLIISTIIVISFSYYQFVYIPNLTPIRHLFASSSVQPYLQTVNTIYASINSTPKFYTGYNGSFRFNTSSPLGTIAFVLPLSITYVKNGSNSRVYLNIAKIPSIGNLDIIEILLGKQGQAFTCTSSFGFSKSKTGYLCYLQNYSDLTNSIINSTILRGNKFSSAYVTSLGVKDIKNDQCLLLSSNFTLGLNLAYGYNKVDVSSYSCIIPKTSLPYNLTVNFHNQNITGSLFLQQMYYMNTVNTDITILPGPIANNTPIVPNVLQNLSFRITNTSLTGNIFVGVWNGELIKINPVKDISVENLPDANFEGQLLNFETNNSAYSCLNSQSLNVWTAPSEYPNKYVVRNKLDSVPCTYITLTFNKTQR